MFLEYLLYSSYIEMKTDSLLYLWINQSQIQHFFLFTCFGWFNDASK